MPNGLQAVLNNSIARKYIMGATGLMLVGFAVLHLIGNIQLLFPDGGAAFNQYGAMLHSLGEFFYLMELGLFSSILIHAYMGVMVTRQSADARPIGYAVDADAGGPSMKNKASTNMIRTGVILFVFLAVHLYGIRFGEHWVIADSPTLGGTLLAQNNPEMLDLAGLTVTLFQNPLYVLFYVACMAGLGMHLRHGFWSAFQSLGLNHPKLMPTIQASAAGIAIALAIGFLFLPVWVFLDPMGLYTEMIR
jgi:succinate dehydrogenase / fumarate reductase, cytochrome b subunit